MGKSVILLLTLASGILYLTSSCTEIEYVDRIETVYQLDTIYLPSTDKYKDYKTVVISKNNGTYNSLKDAFNSLEKGRYILYLPDSLYVEYVDCNLDIKEGWILKGRGIEQTKIVFYDVSPETHSYNLNVTGSSEVHDMSLLSITRDIQSRYCIHMDDERISDLSFCCDNVLMEGRWESENAFNRNGNMLVLGIGTWDNWRIVFKNCIIKGDERIKQFEKGFGVVNLHNDDSKTPSKVVFDNCRILSGGNSVLIRDHRYVFNNDHRQKDTIEFINTSIQGYIVGYSTNESRNGFYFRSSNSSIDGIIEAHYLADPRFPDSYSFFTLPVDSNIRFLQNNSGEDLPAGTLVNIEYNSQEYYWNIHDRIPLMTGVSTASEQTDALLLVNCNKDKSAHVLVNGVGRINSDYTINCNVGDYVKLNGNRLEPTSFSRILYLGDRIIKIL